MRYEIIDNTLDGWKIIKSRNGEFATLKQAKNELIKICKTHIEDEKQMIKAVKNFNL